MMKEPKGQLQRIFATLESHAGLLLLSLLCAGCNRAPPNTYQGYIEGEFVYLASSQPGQLERLAVTRGQSVSPSTLLFALDSTNEVAAVQQAREQMLATQSQRADLAAGKRPEEIGIAEAQRVQAQAEAARAAAQFNRDQEQYRIGGISQTQFDQSRATAAISAARVSELQGQLTVARMPSRYRQIEAASAQMRAAEAALTQAQWKLDQKTMHAPQGGLVYDTLYRAGEWVPAGSPVVRLLPPENVKVRFFVPETLIGSLRIGQAVRVRCDGCSDEVSATVNFVSAQSEYTPPVIYSNENRAKLVFLVEARPQLSDAPKLRPGQPVAVTLQ